MQFAYTVLAIIGKLSTMLIVLGVAVLVSQAFWSAVVMQGARLVNERQVLTMRDVVRGMGEDGVWLAYLLRHPVPVFASLFCAAMAFRAGVTHPGWIGIVLVGAFFAFGPVLNRARRLVATLATATLLRLPTKT